MALRGPKFWGGSGHLLKVPIVVLNLNEEDSKKFNLKCKERGVKPFAALLYAAVSGYRKVLNKYPKDVTMQASLQRQCYEPRIEERNLCGDWLQGGNQKIPSSGYTLEDSQRGYERLLHEIENQCGSIAESYTAKAYGFLCPGGAAGIFQCLPTYSMRSRVYNGIFFNNYGVREVHEAAELISWNWAAPTELGCNCICVNGKTCISFASIVHGLETIKSIRDAFDDVIQNEILDYNPIPSETASTSTQEVELASTPSPSNINLA